MVSKMRSIIISILLVTLFVCNSVALFVHDNDSHYYDFCPEQKDCNNCFKDKGCAFWYCLLPNGEHGNQTFCKNTTDSGPEESCQGKWHKVEWAQGTCDSINTTDNKPEILSTKKPSMSYSKTLINDYNCSDYKECETCFADTHCAFWYCKIGQDEWTGDMVCEHPDDKRPKTHCEGKWKRLEKSHNCSTIHKRNSTTTTTTTTTTTMATTSTSSTTTLSPETTTTKNTTTTTTKPTTTAAPIKTTTTGPPDETQGKLTGWTIAGITLSSLIVLMVLIGASYKKVMKMYQARNPYRTLND